MRETLPWGGHHFYDRVAGRLFAGLFAKLARQRPEAQAVLDLGCGPGHLVAALSRTRADVLGIDLDPRQVRIARKRASVVVGASHALPLQDGSRDWIIATETFHHWAQPMESLVEMRRVLEPGGEAWIVEIASDLTRQELAAWTRLHRVPGMLSVVRLMAREHGYTRRRMEEEVLPMAAAAGFSADLRRESGWWRLVLS